MSVKALTWAFAQPVAGNEKCVLLALADRARDDGVCWPGQADIAGKAHVSTKTVQRAMASLEAAGLIVRSPRYRPDGGRTSDLIRLAIDPPVSVAGDPPVNVAGGLPDTVVQAPRTTVSEEPSREPSSLAEASPQCESAGASAQVKLVVLDAPKPKLPKLAGKPVNEALWGMTLRVLDAFNEHAGRKYRVLKSSGEPSEAAKYVYKRVREYPDLTYDEHVGIIKRTIASRWWGDGLASFNVVYGPKVFEENITRPGIPQARASSYGARRSPEEQAKRDEDAAMLRQINDELARRRGEA